MAFGDALNAQIGQEFAASQQYAAIAVSYDAQKLPCANISWASRSSTGFLQEQREEVPSMSALLQVVERSWDNVMLIEDYLVRESSGAAKPLEAGAPLAAGGAL